MSQVVYLTQEGLKKLQNELTHLKEVTRVEIAEKLKEAISFGDLSENAEYEEARNLQAQVEVRISELEEQLKHVEIINEDQKDTSKVSMGDIVVIENVSEETTVEYLIVGTTESNILSTPAKISNESPVGKALMGKKKGAKVKVRSHAGVTEYKIINIS